MVAPVGTAAAAGAEAATLPTPVGDMDTAVAAGADGGRNPADARRHGHGVGESEPYVVSKVPCFVTSRTESRESPRVAESRELRVASRDGVESREPRARS